MIAALLLVGLLPATATAAAGERVAVLEPTVSDGAASIEAAKATALGYEVDLLSPDQWRAKTASEFGAYRALILGDPTCGDLGPQAAAEETAALWGPQVDGNVLLIGTDPVFHADQGGRALTESGIAYAANVPGRTGAYITLSCYYHGTAEQTPIPLLAGLSSSGFTMRGVGCYDDAHIVADHEVFASTISDATLSNWSCSVHEAFDAYPSDFLELAIAKDIGSTYVAPDGTSGTPYILARGQGTTLRGRSIVSLGDSVSAGEGIGEPWQWEPGDEIDVDRGADEPEYFDGEWEPNGTDYPWLTDSVSEFCHQTAFAHDRVVAQALFATLEHLSCTGSTAFNGVLGPREAEDVTREQAQLGSSTVEGAALPNPRYDEAEPDVVTLSLGANDVHFADVVKDCISNDCDTDAEELDDALATQRENLETILDEIDRRGTQAGKKPLVLLTAYADPFPLQWTDDCPDLDVPVPTKAITRDEMEFMRDGLSRLNMNLVLESFSHDSAYVVRTPEIYRQHHFCTENPWTFGPSLAVDNFPSNLDSQTPFHPTIDGQGAIAGEVAAAIRDRLPARAGVDVPVRYGTGERLMFDAVTTEGAVLFTRSDARDLPAASSFRPSRLYDITTSASFTGGVTLSIPGVDGESIFHFVDGAWQQLVTTFANGLLSARVSSFSPFATGVPVAKVTASAAPVTRVTAPEAVQFDASGSSVAGDSSPIESVLWTFGDGSSAEGLRPTHVYRQSGSYDAVARVRSAEGGVDTTTVRVEVVNPAPVAVLTGPAELQVGEDGTFSAAGSTDANGRITETAWTVDGGDPVAAATITRSFASPGVREVVLRVADDEGAPGTAVQRVTVVAAPPSPGGGGTGGGGGSGAGGGSGGGGGATPPGPGSTPPGTAPVPPRAPLVRLLSTRQMGSRSVRVVVRCAATLAKCSGRIVLTRNGRTVGQASFKAKRGAKVTVTIRTPRTLRKGRHAVVSRLPGRAGLTLGRLTITSPVARRR